MKLKELLRDDFIDDPSMAPDADYAPVKLPLLASGQIYIYYCIYLHVRGNFILSELQWASYLMQSYVSLCVSPYFYHTLSSCLCYVTKFLNT
jgi:hypothetical protein